MTAHDVILPELRPQGRPQIIPRRYEETRPVILQSFTHRSILDMGQDLHKHFLHEFNKEKVQAMQAVEAAVWEEADMVKKEAVENALKKAQAEHEKTIKKLNKAHDRTLKEEMARLSIEMDRVRQEEVEKAKQDGEKAKREAVKQTEELWQRKLLQAVDAARQEERQRAADKAAVVARQHKQDLALLRQELYQEKMAALVALDKKKEKEQQVAVALAREEEQKTAAKQLAHIKHLYEQQLTILQSQIARCKEEITNTQQQLNAANSHNATVKGELKETRLEFQNFIEMVRPFNNTESKYLIPPLQSFDANDDADTENK